MANTEASPLIALLQDELIVQRVFLSSDEVRALSRCNDGEDDGDLAFERVKARRYLFYAAMRDRFLLDSRPIAEWMRWITEAEAQADGQPTVVTALATRVIAWSIRSADRRAMAMGFIGAVTRWFAMVCLGLGAWGWSRDIGPAWVVLAIVGGGAWVGARVIERITEAHVRAIIASTRALYLDA